MIVRLFRLLEGDQLEVGSVGKADERVVGSARVLAAASDLKAQPLVALNRVIELAHQDHEMVDSGNHMRPFLASVRPAVARANMLVVRRRATHDCTIAAILA